MNREVKLIIAEYKNLTIDEINHLLSKRGGSVIVNENDVLSLKQAVYLYDCFEKLGYKPRPSVITKKEPKTKAETKIQSKTNKTKNQHKEQQNTYMSDGEFEYWKERYYKALKQCFDRSVPGYVSSLHKLSKNLIKQAKNDALIDYIKKTTEKFDKYSKENALKKKTPRVHHEDKVAKDVRRIFHEASSYGTTSRGNAYEMGNFKYNTHFIYIAKKN